jgi:hypothetical protein
MRNLKMQKAIAFAGIALAPSSKTHEKRITNYDRKPAHDRN